MEFLSVLCDQKVTTESTVQGKFRQDNGKQHSFIIDSIGSVQTTLYIVFLVMVPS